MNKISHEYISAIVIVIISLLAIFKVKVSTEEVLPIVEGLATGILGIYIMIRRYKKGDLTLAGIKKTKVEEPKVAPDKEETNQ